MENKGKKEVKYAKKTSTPARKKKSGFSFFRLFTWGCGGKSKTKVGKPKNIVGEGKDKPVKVSKKEEMDKAKHDKQIEVDDIKITTRNSKSKPKNSYKDEFQKAESWPAKQTIDSRKSREASPDSDDLSGYSESESKNSDERSSEQHTNEGTNPRKITETSSEDTDSNPSLSSESDESEQDIIDNKNSSDEESEESPRFGEENLQLRSGRKSDKKKPENPSNLKTKTLSSLFNKLPTINKDEGERTKNQYGSSEQDEISGSLIPCQPHIMPEGSVLNPVSEDNEVGRESMQYMTRKEETKVGVPRYSSRNEEKMVWENEEDEVLRNVTERQK